MNTGNPSQPLARTLEPELMDTAEEAQLYDAMDHAEVNRRFVDDLLATIGTEWSEPARPHVIDAKGVNPSARMAFANHNSCGGITPEEE